MSFNARSIATLGVGFGALAIATIGFIAAEPAAAQLSATSGWSVAASGREWRAVDSGRQWAVSASGRTWVAELDGRAWVARSKLRGS